MSQVMGNEPPSTNNNCVCLGASSISPQFLLCESVGPRTFTAVASSQDMLDTYWILVKRIHSNVSTWKVLSHIGLHNPSFV